METQDKISALPDEVLGHILSFLSTQEAMSTSLVSKRWQPLWLSIPILDLDDITFIQNGKSYSSFFNFAFGSLLARNVQQPLTLARLRLNSRGNDDNFPYSHFKIWVNAVIQRGLEHLQIEMPRPFELPNTILNCKTLVVLKLHRLRVDALGSVHLPALKTLHLDNFTMLETWHLAKVLHECPILEDLRANNMFFYNNSDVVEFQIMPKLVRAEIKVNFRYEIPLKVATNVEYLRFFLKPDTKCIPVFHNLIHLELNFWFVVRWNLVFEMIKHCPKLQTFVLLLPLESFPPILWTFPQIVPECISSQLRKCTIMNYKGKKYELQFAKYILQNSRALQSMTIHNKRIGNTYFANPQDKFRILQELAMCPKRSTTCKILFKS